eukprot:s250_g2.t1
MLATAVGMRGGGGRTRPFRKTAATRSHTMEAKSAPAAAITTEPSKARLLWEISTFANLSCRARLAFCSKASRHVHQFVRLTDTMGIVPSAALGIVINNHGNVSDFYKLDAKPLGEGSFGAVFYATLRVTKASRAIKKIPKDPRHSKQHRGRSRC